MRILIIEDDDRLADVVRRALTENGHVVDVEADGLDGERAALAGQYDAIVLDVLLPRKDGLAVARALRARGNRTPVLMLTARDEVDDAVAGLDAGADDYLRKPFAMRELQARLRSIARRDAVNPGTALRAGDIVLDLATMRVTRAGREIAMTPREIAFLEYFMRNAGRVVSKQMIEDALWESDRETDSNIIEVYVRRLRAKLGAAGEPPLIETLRGAGYRFAPPSA